MNTIEAVRSLIRYGLDTELGSLGVIKNIEF